MVRSPVRRAGYALLTVGAAAILLALLSGFWGASTARACPGVDGAVYDAVGVHPAGVAVEGLDLSTLSLEWYDGCNQRSTPLVPPLAGVLLLVQGAVLAVRRS